MLLLCVEGELGPVLFLQSRVSEAVITAIDGSIGRVGDLRFGRVIRRVGVWPVADAQGHGRTEVPVDLHVPVIEYLLRRSFTGGGRRDGFGARFGGRDSALRSGPTGGGRGRDSALRSGPAGGGRGVRLGRVRRLLSRC